MNKIADLNRGDVQKLYNTKATYSVSVAFHWKYYKKLMGHAKEIITMDVYGDNKGIIADRMPEMLDANQYLSWTSNKL